MDCIGEIWLMDELNNVFEKVYDDLRSAKLQSPEVSFSSAKLINYIFTSCKHVKVHLGPAILRHHEQTKMAPITCGVCHAENPKYKCPTCEMR